MFMNIDLFVHGDTAQEVKDEVYECSEYCLKMSPALGKLVIKTELSLDIDNIFSADFAAKKDEVLRFNALGNNADNIHFFVVNSTNFNSSFTGLNVANIALVSAIEKPIAHPLIHEFGHAMGLVQPTMRNYWADSSELAGGENSNHCFAPFCIMSTRNIEPELKIGRYANYKTDPKHVFCDDCSSHLDAVKLEELPWYNQVKS